MADYDEDPSIRTPDSPVPSGLLIRFTRDDEAGRLPVILAADGFHRRPTSRAGAIAVNPGDVVREHMDSTGTGYGCCGSSGLSGPNRACTCGLIVGTEWSDCWTKAEVRFIPDAVDVVN
jgi:hypothetical protein